MKKKELNKISDIIRKDSLYIDGEFSEMLSKDLTKVLSEYFELDKKTDLKIEKNEDKISVKITATAKKIKYFNKIEQFGY